jgi:hypothetical protein
MSVPRLCRLAPVEAQKDLAFRPICLPTPGEKRRPRDVEFGSYACSAGPYIIVYRKPNPMTARTLGSDAFGPAPTR